MDLFEMLNEIRAQQRATMPFVQSMEDHDLVLEIGTAQEQGSFASAKNILAKRIGAPATMRRRLDRLVRLGVVRKSANKADARVAELRLAPEVLKAQRGLKRSMQRAMAKMA